MKEEEVPKSLENKKVASRTSEAPIENVTDRMKSKNMIDITVDITTDIDVAKPWRAVY